MQAVPTQGPSPDGPTAPTIPDTDTPATNTDTDTDTDTPNGFAALGVRPETVADLAGAGITEPFAIQRLTLPVALGGADVIGQARTGTGKTLGFAVPLLQRLAAPGEVDPPLTRPQALVVVPTRELCTQVTADVSTAGRTRRVRVQAIYGGRSYEPQVAALAAGVDVVVGTPGRLLDLASQRHLDLSAVRTLVLDEADEMLDLGFLPDIERILAMVPADRQTMLFSATMPGPIVTLARRFLRQPVHIRAEEPDEGRTVPTTRQHVLRAHALDKTELLARVLQADGRGLTMIFTRTKRTADKVAADLEARGFAAAAVHGDLGQGQREQALRAFRSGKVDVLVATDVAARGIDVTGVTHVVNYQCPEDEKVYIHRIGRTGRAGESGTAITLVDWDDIPRWKLINAELGLPFDEPVETYSSSPHLYDALDIPRSATGTLPRAARTREGLDAERIEDLGETGRTRSRHRTRASSDSDATARPAGRPRARRRTRGGGAALAAVTSTAGTADRLDEAGAAESAAPDGTATAEVGGGPRRRRRRRGGRGRGAASGAAAQDTGSAGSDSSSD